MGSSSKGEKKKYPMELGVKRRRRTRKKKWKKKIEEEEKTEKKEGKGRGGQEETGSLVSPSV